MTTKPQNFLTEEQDLFTNLFTNTFASTWVQPALVVSGTDEDDALTGSNDRDTLNGGLGADTMTGLGGADTYVVDNVGDVIIESKGGGVDTVLASVSYTLATNVEKITLTGYADINAIGNDGNNVLRGNIGTNMLFGGGGDDTLFGSIGDDTLAGGEGDDTFLKIISGDISGGEGNDTVIIQSLSSLASGPSYWMIGNNIQLTANSSANTISSAIQTVISYGADYSIAPAFSQTSSLHFSGIENLSVLEGSQYSDLIFALGNGSTYNGAGGSDTFFANWSNITSAVHWVNDGGTVDNGTTISSMERLVISTGSADDYIDVSDANARQAGDYIFTGDGNDTIVATSIVGSYSDPDFYIGGNGDDTFLNIRAGIVSGGDGVDTAVIQSLSGFASGPSYWMIGNNIQLTANSSANTISSAIQTVISYGADYSIAPAFSQTSRLHFSGIENLSVLEGSQYSDLIFALGNGSTYNGAGGSDTFFANWSNITSAVHWVNDGGTVDNGTTISSMERLVIGTGSADDYIDVSDASARQAGDYIFTGDGNDTIVATSTVGSYSDPDFYIGGNGDDTFLNIHAGSVSGGDGVDTAVIQSLSTPYYWVVDGVRLTANSASASIESALSSHGLYSIFNGSTTSATLQISNVENLSILEGSQYDDLIFSLGSGATSNGGKGLDTFAADWSGVTNAIDWHDGGTTSNGFAVSDMERLIITTGSGDDYIQSKHVLSDFIATGAGNDTIDCAGGADVITTGIGSDTVIIRPKSAGMTITDFSSGEDHLLLPMQTTATAVTSDHFSAYSKFVIFTTDVEDDTISARSAAAAIGSADSAYTSGQSAIFVVDNGVDSLVYRFLSSGNDATVSASELTLLATLSGTASTTLADYAFGS